MSVFQRNEIYWEWEKQGFFWALRREKNAWDSCENFLFSLKSDFSPERVASSAAALNQKYSFLILHPIGPEGALGIFWGSHSHFSNYGLCFLLKNLSSFVAHTMRLYYFLLLLVNTCGLLCPKLSFIDDLASGPLSFSATWLLLAFLMISTFIDWSKFLAPRWNLLLPRVPQQQTKT